MIALSAIQSLHIELTTRCNAACPMCMRNYRGMDYNGGYPLTELTLDQIMRIFPPEFLGQITNVQFNGNLGDFSLAQDAQQIMRYFLDHSPAKILITTNGSTRSTEWWAQLAHPRVSVVFTLDGLEDTHHLYRQNTDWQRTYSHARALIDAGGNAIWKMIIFDHNQHQLGECQHMSKRDGFCEFWPVDQGRDQGPVFDKSGTFRHWLGVPRSDTPDARQMLEHHKIWFMEKQESGDFEDSPGPIRCEAKQYQSIYLAADGSVYPCCYLGYFPTSMQHAGNEQIKDLVRENDALEYGLEHSLAWFAEIEKLWSRPTIKQGRPMICVRQCSQPFQSQKIGYDPATDEFLINE